MGREPLPTQLLRLQPRALAGAPHGRQAVFTGGGAPWPAAAGGRGRGGLRAQQPHLLRRRTPLHVQVVPAAVMPGVDALDRGRHPLAVCLAPILHAVTQGEGPGTRSAFFAWGGGPEAQVLRRLGPGAQVRRVGLPGGRGAAALARQPRSACWRRRRPGSRRPPDHGAGPRRRGRQRQRRLRPAGRRGRRAERPGREDLTRAAGARARAPRRRGPPCTAAADAQQF
mmetsp:Transcript_95823/g.291070  ORF Transcript_95823/g.291070 Transcript_95823/m.291070 type:complete len:226 (+) Transcript_95823:629-1306(+)